MTVVLFCGGRGIRLRSHAPVVPKPLVPIGREPILTHLMRWYAHHGHRDFVICLGHGGARISRHFLRELDPVATESSAGGVHRVRLRPDAGGDWTVTLAPTGLDASIGERLRAVRGAPGRHGVPRQLRGRLSDLDLPEFLARFRASGAVGGLVTVPHPSTHHLVTADRHGLVESVRASRASGLRVNGGFFAFRPEIFDWLAPGEDLVDGLFPRLVCERPFFAHAHDGFWACMDTPKDWQVLQDLESGERAPWKAWMPAPGTSAALDPRTPRLAPSDRGA